MSTVRPRPPAAQGPARKPGPLVISPSGYLDPVARWLVDAAMADLAARYGGGDETPVAAVDFDPPAGLFLVAWLDGEPAGCGGWRTFHGDPAAAEIKRMFTVPAARGRGVALAVLRELERTARSAGRQRMILETGDRQPEAIALYLKAGYTRIENFGYYKDEPGALSFGRTL